ncbi:hypothetical protein [Blastomonas fulva]|uniref:hypothetical protein n=1 Tax=Blastomonas fulva TaxID=1550728 RepID=UPI0024E1E264|nr:hypothetical protein [Blastomonas fulva]MDK2757436.1 hypothetical protein [Blastomonas fulva]MDM7929990.1 hypothetical protein [Blastomonas fulva]MDM7966245.1 hypothetical protein [Blastomonas fulva]
MTRPLDDVTAMIAQARSLGPDETLALRRAVWPDGKISAQEAGILFALNRVSSAPSREWVDFFVEAITAYLVEQADPRGYVSDENAAWLMQAIDQDGKVDTLAELELVVKVIERAENVPDSLKAYALDQIRHAVLHGQGPTRCGDALQPGSIGTAEVRLLRRVLYAAGGAAPAHINRAEAELLFEIKDATLAGQNAPEWQTLFVQALSLHLMTNQRFRALTRQDAQRLHAFMADTSAGIGSFFGRMAGSLADRTPLGAASSPAAEPEPAPEDGLTASEQDWLQAMVGGDGKLDPLERALLKALAEA